MRPDTPMTIRMPEINAEWKAFVYQQIAEFEPYFMPDSNIGVSVSRDEKKAYLVTLILSGGGTYVRSEGVSHDLFEATSNAKDELLSHLKQIEVMVAYADEDRAKSIDYIVQSSPYLH